MRLFISYASEDKPIVKNWIVDKLTAGGHDVWFDDRLVAGQNWQQQLADEIRKSDALVYALTPESVESDWCQWELKQAVEQGKPIIPVLMQARTAVPAPLDALQYVDFTKGATADAVARLMGGLQQLSPAQLPDVPNSPQEMPPQAINGNGDTATMTNQPDTKNGINWTFWMTAIATVATVIGVILAAIPLLDTRSTPDVPVYEALRRVDIRRGAATTSERIGELQAGEFLEAIGISENRRWVQVILPDGRTGWVVNTASSGEISGDTATLAVIVPTETLTPMPSNTPTSTHTAIATNTSSPTSTPERPNTPAIAPQSVVPTNTVAANPIRSYPCDAQVDPFSTSTTLNVVKQFPNPSSRTITSIRRNQEVVVIERSAGSNTYYRIQSAGTTLGWVAEEHLNLAENCP